MARFITAQKENIGLSPDAMLFQGKKKSDRVRLRQIEYNADFIHEKDITDISEIDFTDNSSTTSWLNVDGLHDNQIIQQIAQKFHIESLIISDLLDTYSRPKIHEYDDCIYISLKMLQYNEKQHQLVSENLVLIIKNHWLISFQEREGDVFNPVRERLRNNKKRLRNSGSDYLAVALLDTVIDNYIYIISCLGEKIEALDEKLMQKISKDTLSEIDQYKSEMIYLRKIIKPCREVVLNFNKSDSDLIHKNIQAYLKQVHSNIELANDSIDNYREILSDLLNVFQSNVSNKLNDILKILTIFSVFFIPITFIVGVYGTNFDNIPLIHFRFGYLIMWLIIILTVVIMIFLFHRKKWL
ncbi:MAG: magnesium/cobalt transporter CorA [Bacteroidales bacterium]|nr:magnesium/cobalt transporter CorA [Bacteroidales bacterium]